MSWRPPVMDEITGRAVRLGSHKWACTCVRHKCDGGDAWGPLIVATSTDSSNRFCPGPLPDGLPVNRRWATREVMPAPSNSSDEPAAAVVRYASAPDTPWLHHRAAAGSEACRWATHADPERSSRDSASLRQVRKRCSEAPNYADLSSGPDVDPTSRNGPDGPPYRHKSRLGMVLAGRTSAWTRTTAFESFFTRAVFAAPASLSASAQERASTSTRGARFADPSPNPRKSKRIGDKADRNFPFSGIGPACIPPACSASRSDVPLTRLGGCAILPQLKHLTVMCPPNVEDPHSATFEEHRVTRTLELIHCGFLVGD
jgi:hypothetical protein